MTATSGESTKPFPEYPHVRFRPEIEGGYSGEIPSPQQTASAAHP